MARSTRSRRTNRPNNTTANDDDLTSPPSPGSHIDARPHLEGRRAGLLSALAQCTVPAWASTVVMVSLIFGGCCSNVFALEAIIK